MQCDRPTIVVPSTAHEQIRGVYLEYRNVRYATSPFGGLAASLRSEKSSWLIFEVFSFIVLQLLAVATQVYLEILSRWPPNGR